MLNIYTNIEIDCEKHKIIGLFGNIVNNINDSHIIICDFDLLSKTNFEGNIRFFENLLDSSPSKQPVLLLTMTDIKWIKTNNKSIFIKEYQCHKSFKTTVFGFLLHNHFFKKFPLSAKFICVPEIDIHNMNIFLDEFDDFAYLNFAYIDCHCKESFIITAAKDSQKIILFNFLSSVEDLNTLENLGITDVLVVFQNNLSMDVTTQALVLDKFPFVEFVDKIDSSSVKGIFDRYNKLFVGNLPYYDISVPKKYTDTIKDEFYHVIQSSDKTKLLSVCRDILKINDFVGKIKIFDVIKSNIIHNDVYGYFDTSKKNNICKLFDSFAVIVVKKEEINNITSIKSIVDKHNMNFISEMKLMEFTIDKEQFNGNINAKFHTHKNSGRFVEYITYYSFQVPAGSTIFDVLKNEQSNLNLDTILELNINGSYIYIRNSIVNEINMDTVFGVVERIKTVIKCTPIIKVSISILTPCQQ